MDKKGGRSVQPASKGPPTDCKKSQDGTPGKPWPRGGRRREPPGGSSGLSTKPTNNPSSRSSNTTKTFDNNNKRPRARGGPNSNSFDPPFRAEAARLGDPDEAELGSVFVPGSKKQSLNHLLNFVYTNSYADDRKSTKVTRTSLMLTRKHKYNKEHFLQANCRFIVKSTGVYTHYLNDPDALVDWNLIEQVSVQVSTFSSCPICLYPPVAAKMTRCGHIYCWPCLLHYLSLSDKTWRKCPICYEAVHLNDLKSVISVPHSTFNVDDVITFKLMKRARGSLTAYPATDEDFDTGKIFNVSESNVENFYSKLLLADRGEILAIIEREEVELSVELADSLGSPECCFVEQAIGLLGERKNVLCNEVAVSPPEPVASVGNTVEFDVDDVAGSSHSSKFHYFYQASDGQHIYLHAINARMLEHTYGSLEFGPKTITGKILEKEGGSMTEELRKRLRYLQHLPVTCQFEVAEIQLKQPNVNKETIQHFQDQVEVRRKRRQRRAKEEKKREKRIQDEENRLIGKYPANPTPNLHIDSQLQFPGFEQSPPRPRCESEGTQDDGNSTDGWPTPSSSVNLENEYSGPSFATMLSHSKKKATSEKWPSLKNEDPVKLINVTGQRMQKTASGFSGQRGKSDSEPDLVDNEYDPAPGNSSLGDAIAQALQKAEEEDLAESNSSVVMGKKKKKKNKQKILFTTAVAFLGK